MATLEDRVYRPPLEANSELLEVALGCSYGKCTFCQYSNGKTPLQLVSSEMLCENLEEIIARGSKSRRMFLLGGNVMAFKSRYLTDIFRLIKSYLPEVSQFSMYARADDVAHKSDVALEELRREGLSTLYVGVESGNPEILRRCKKGESPDEIVMSLWRLDAAGIKYGLSSILGLGGVEMWKENAKDTAALYNKVHPVSIRVMTLTPMKGSPLEREVAGGLFTPLSPVKILEEERLLLQNISYKHSRCLFTGTHVSNVIPVRGMLPDDRSKMIEKLSEVIDAADGLPKEGIEVAEW